MRLEIGGGVDIRKRHDGWTNMDLVDSADILHDLNQRPWPIPDDSVSEVYSSHCIEHLTSPFAAFEEICRVCKLGSHVEIRVPSPNSHLAMTCGHVHVFSPVQAINMEHYFPQDFWKHPKRMKLNKRDNGEWDIRMGACFLIHEIRRDLPMLAGVSDEVLMKWFVGTAHECCFHYTVVKNEFVGKG